MGATNDMVASTTTVWLLSSTGTISRHYPLWLPCTIQHDTGIMDKDWYNRRISELWATIASIWLPSRRLWWTLNVPPSAIHRTRAFISRHTSSASSNAGKQSSRTANILTSSASIPPVHHSGAPVRPPINHPMNQFLPSAELRTIDVGAFADQLSLLGGSYAIYNTDDQSDILSDMGAAEGTAPISQMQPVFYSKQFAKRMGESNFITFNRWKKVWVSGFLGKKHQSIIQGQNHLTQLWDRPLYRVTVVADMIMTFQSWLQVEYFNSTNGFIDSESRCFWRNVQTKFGGWGRRLGKAEMTSDRFGCAR